MDRPTLSLRERDRRWELTTRMMKEKGLDCLIVTPGNTYYSPDYFDAWLTNDNATGTVIFPLNGDPTYVVWSPMHGTIRMLQAKKRGVVPWVQDYRVFKRARDGIVSVVREKGLASATIGVVGLTQEGPGTIGGVAYGDWSVVVEQLPDARFVDVFQEFGYLGLVHSEEEIAVAKYASHIGDLACKAMVETVKPGVSETEIYAAIMGTIFKNGANALHVIMHSGVDNLSWGMPSWTYTAMTPRVIEKGDLVQAEIFPIYGGMESQQQMVVATGPVDSMTRQLADIAHRSYQIAVDMMRPGVTFGAVCDAMEKPIREVGGWYLTPLAHTMNPAFYTSALVNGIEKVPELKDYPGFKLIPMRPAAREYVLEPGVIFELEPNVCLGTRKVNVGATVLITEDGCEELNEMARMVAVVD